MRLSKFIFVFTTLICISSCNRSNQLSTSSSNPIVTQTGGSGGSSGSNDGGIQPNANCSGDPSKDSYDDLPNTITNDHYIYQFPLLMAGSGPPITANSNVATYLASHPEPTCTSWIPNSGGQCSGPDLNETITDNGVLEPKIFTLFKNDGPIYVRVRVSPAPGNDVHCPGRVPYQYNTTTQLPTYRVYDYPYGLVSFKVRSKILTKNGAASSVSSSVLNELGTFRILKNACSPVIKVMPPTGSNPNTATVVEIYDLRINSECQQYYAAPWQYNLEDYNRMCVDLMPLNSRNCIDLKVDVATNRTYNFAGSPARTIP
jgi:hypothetical protein